MPKKKSEHYVNNKEFLEALIVYRSKVENARENDLPKPRITNYLGDNTPSHNEFNVSCITCVRADMYSGLVKVINSL